MGVVLQRKSDEVITQAQEKVIQRLSKLEVVRKEFYWGGATALSLFYYAHRRSFDLDFFTKKLGLFSPEFAAFVGKNLPGYKVELIEPFKIVLRGETEIDFVYQPSFIEPPDYTETGLKVMSYKDLIANKVSAFCERRYPRDVVDFYFILKHEPLWDLLSLTFKREEWCMDLPRVIAAVREVMEFPDDISEWKIAMLKPVTAKEIKQKLEEVALEIRNTIDQIKDEFSR